VLELARFKIRQDLERDYRRMENRYLTAEIESLAKKKTFPWAASS